MSGTVNVTANASDNIAVAGVQFLLDGTNLGAEDTSSPYSTSWNTTGATTGTHMLSAIARDPAGNTKTSTSVTVTVDNSAPTVLLGDQQVEPNDDSDPAGTAEAFRTSATTAGIVSELRIYVNSNATATNLVAGLYADSSGHPGTLLTQGQIAAPVKGAWNAVPVPGASVTSGTTYWVAVLGPLGSGTLHFRDRFGGGNAETSSATSLTSLQATWTTGGRYTDGPLSAYATGSLSSVPVLQVAPSLLGFSARLNGADPAPAQLSVTNGGSGTSPSLPPPTARGCTSRPRRGRRPARSR